MKDDHYDLHGDPQIKKELLEESREPGWLSIYEDGNYIIQKDKFTHLFRYMANTLLGSDVWHNGLPKDYEFLGGKIQKAIPFKVGEMGPESIMPKREPKAEVTVTQFIDSNPKTAFGAVKPGTFQTPVMPLYEYSLAHYQGALKYGHLNWREDPVSISTYINAARRHIDLYMEGQTYSSDTGDTLEGIRGIHNLAHSMTCLSIVMDAEFFGTLIDDRAPEGLRAADKLEQYFEETKKLQQHLMKTWTGHAQQLKAKLAASKETKGDK